MRRTIAGVAREWAPALGWATLLALCLLPGGPRADDRHFYYAHLRSSTDAVHNGVLIVNDADRAPVTLSSPAPPVLLDGDWHTVKLVREPERGLIEVYLDDLGAPLLRAFDRTFHAGLVGLGAFGSRGDFDDLRIEGVVER